MPTKSSGSKKIKKEIKTKWKKIKRFPGYLVSNKGKIYSKHLDAFLKPSKNGKYHYVHLSINGVRKTKSIHRLVAEAFIKNPKKLPRIDHIDNNGFNNHIDNLKWTSSKDNTTEYYKNFHKYSTILQCDKNGNTIKKWNSIIEILETHPEYKKKSIYNNLCDPKRSAYGYFWKYENKAKKEIKLEKGEIFKNIGIFEGRNLSSFDVSSHGKIRNEKGRLLGCTRNKSGYIIADLKDNDGIRKKYIVHRLVAHAFISESPGSNIVVNHIDENKSNNYFKNLEWLTKKGNNIHSSGKAIKMIDKKNNEILMIFKAISVASSFLLLKYSGIKRCADGKIKSYCGFKWEYLKDNETLNMFEDTVYIYKDDE